MKQTATKGRVPISKKSTENSDFAPMDTGLLRVDAAIKAEIEAKGLAYRWISRKDFAENGNFHKHDWVPYKSESLKKTASEFAFGSNPDGYLIRKEMVLAVKPKAMQDAHKAQIARKNALQSNYQKQAANELKQTLQGSGAQVYEGYERNGDDDGDDE